MTILLNLRDTGYNDNIIKSPRHWVLRDGYNIIKISETLGTMTILLNLGTMTIDRHWVQ